MRKKPKVGESTATVRVFQPKWLSIYEFLRYDPDAGMWCWICHKFRHLSDVQGRGAAKNALMVPTTAYRHERLKDHADQGYHRAALHHLSKQAAISNSAVLLPFSPTVREQLMVYFRTVYSMAKRGVAHRQIIDELALLRLCGVSYQLRYGIRHVREALKYLSLVLRNTFRRQFLTASHRCAHMFQLAVYFALDFKNPALDLRWFCSFL